MADEKNAQAAEQAGQNGGEETAGKKRKRGLGLVVGAVLLFGSSVAVGLLAFPDPHAATEEPQSIQEESEPEETYVLLPVPQMLVNLADTNGVRLLQVQMSLEVAAKEPEKVQSRFQDILPKIQDRIIKLLSSLTNQDIDGGTNKEFVQTRIKDVLNMGVLKDEDFEVHEVFFTEFVVQ